MPHQKLYLGASASPKSSGPVCSHLESVPVKSATLYKLPRRHDLKGFDNLVHLRFLVQCLALKNAQEVLIIGDYDGLSNTSPPKMSSSIVTGNHVALHDKNDFAEVLRNWRREKVSWIIPGGQCNHKDPYEREAGRSEPEKVM